MKYATVAPRDFLPDIMFKKFPQLSKEYKAIIDSNPFDKDLIINNQTIELVIEKLKELLIHSFVITQQNNWVFVTQVEVYHKDKDVDDVAIISKLDQYPNKLMINMEKFQEGKGSWYELRFVFKKFEIIATGGLSNHMNNNNKLDAFLGVAAPPVIALDNKFILFSPVQAAKTTSCPRMLRNYRKKASLNPWCIKSLFFSSMEFSTPVPLKFYENEPLGYVSICSKLLYLTTYTTLSINEINSLTDMMVEIKYWNDLGFEYNVEREQILAKLKGIKEIKKPRDRKPSEAKRLLIELLLNYSEDQPINENSLLTLYNGILYPKVKIVNKQRIKMMLKH